jgi:hypothetical protein
MGPGRVLTLPTGVDDNDHGACLPS